MSNEYMDLVILTNGKVCRAPGFCDIKPGQRIIVQGGLYDVLDVVSVLKTEALLTLPQVYGLVSPLEYNEGEQWENADV